MAKDAGKELAIWFYEQGQRLSARIQRMPDDTIEDKVRRMLAAKSGMIELGKRYRERKWKLTKRRGK